MILCKHPTLTCSQPTCSLLILPPARNPLLCLRPPSGFFPDANGEFTVFFDVGFDAKDAKKLLTRMENGFYIDQFSDVVTIQAFTYNAALRVFAVSKVELLFLPAGSIQAETQIDTMSFELYDSFEGKARQTIEIIFVIIVRILLLIPAHTQWGCRAQSLCDLAQR